MRTNARLTMGLLVFAVTGCAPATDGQENRSASNMAAPAAPEPAADATTNAAMNDAMPSKSILRPEIVAPEPTPAPLEPVNRIIAFGQSGIVLDDAGKQAVDSLLADPVLQAGGKITLRGHSDSRGSDRQNLVTSRKRAEAVRDYLLAKGVDPSRIAVIALGETRPMEPNARADGSDDPEARARNRRVEIDVALPDAPAAEATPPSTNSAAPAPAPAPAG